MASAIQNTLRALEQAAKKLRRLEFRPTDDVSSTLSAWDDVLKVEFKPAPSAQCAVELALLDLYGKLLEQTR